MREYGYKDIQNITQVGILFRDGFELSFEECKNQWSIEKILREINLAVLRKGIL